MSLLLDDYTSPDLDKSLGLVINDSDCFYFSQLVKKSVVSIENGFVVAKREVTGGEVEWEVGLARCKVLYIEWINNKVLLYSKESYIQYLMMDKNI